VNRELITVALVQVEEAELVDPVAVEEEEQAVMI